MQPFILRTSLVAQTVKNVSEHRRPGFDPWVGRSPGEGNGNPLQFLPGEFYRQRSLVGYSPGGCKELDRIEQLTLVFVLKEIQIET